MLKISYFVVVRSSVLLEYLTTENFKRMFKVAHVVLTVQMFQCAKNHTFVFK